MTNRYSPANSITVRRAFFIAAMAVGTTFLSALAADPDLICGEEYHRSQLPPLGTCVATLQSRYYFNTSSAYIKDMSRDLVKVWDVKAYCRPGIPCGFANATVPNTQERTLTIQGKVGGFAEESAKLELSAKLSKLIGLGAEVGWSWGVNGELTISLSTRDTIGVSATIADCVDQRYEYWSTTNTAVGGGTKQEVYVWLIAGYPDCSPSRSLQTECQRFSVDGTLRKATGTDVQPLIQPCCHPQPPEVGQPCCYRGPC